MSTMPWKGSPLGDLMIRTADRWFQVSLCDECGSPVLSKKSAEQHYSITRVSIRSWWIFFRHYAKNVFAFSCKNA